MSTTNEPSSTLEQRLSAIFEGDNVSGALPVLNRYPRLPRDRRLSKFEDDLRDWGLTYGIAFALAFAEESLNDADERAADRAAERAYPVARARFTKWSGEFGDPEREREEAMRAAVLAFREAEEGERTAQSMYRAPMTSALEGALIELAYVTGIK